MRPVTLCVPATAESRSGANVAGDADASRLLAVTQVEIIHDFYANEGRLRRSNQMLTTTVSSEVAT